MLHALKPDIIAQRIFWPTPGVSSSYVHSLGAVPKTESTVRVIHEHSRPIGRSLNDALTQTNFSFQSVDDAVRLMSRIFYMAKVDIEAAYRHEPIDPYDWNKTAFCWPTDSMEDLHFDGYLHFSFFFAELMSGPFMRVSTRSQISLRFAKAILSLLRTCPWFESISGALKRSNLVSGPCVSFSRLFPVQCSARLRRYIASSRSWPVAPRTLRFPTPTRLVDCKP
jgi:hypothetical protein